MHPFRSVRWLLPALLLALSPTAFRAEVLKCAGFAPHMLLALGQAAPQAGAAEPETPQKPIANRKHLNVSVGPVKMHIPVSGKRPLPAATPASGNTAADAPVLVHQVQQPLGQPASISEPPVTQSGGNWEHAAPNGGARPNNPTSSEKPAPAGIYDRWGDGPGPIGPDLAKKPTPGASGTGTQEQIDTGVASGGVHKQVTPGAGQKGEEMGVRINVNEHVIEKPANTTAAAPSPNGQKSASDLSGTWNVSEGYTKTSTGILQKDAVEDPKLIVVDGVPLEEKATSSGTQKASTNGVIVITTKKGRQGQTNPAPKGSRSVAAPGSGSGKPQPAENPISAINISIEHPPDWTAAQPKPPAKPDSFTITPYKGLDPEAAKKVNGAPGDGTGKAQGYMAGVINGHIQAQPKTSKGTTQTPAAPGFHVPGVKQHPLELKAQPSSKPKPH